MKELKVDLLCDKQIPWVISFAVRIDAAADELIREGPGVWSRLFAPFSNPCP